MNTTHSTAQLNTWRDQAAKLLATLLPTIPETNFCPTDELADDLLRSLTGQTTRPAARSPYVGLFGNAGLSTLRQKAAGGIKTYLSDLHDEHLTPADAQADRLLRVLRGLNTTLPPGVLPYEALFGYTVSPLSQAQVKAWRRQAAACIQQQLAQIANPEPTDGDIIADGLLRALGRQPARPRDRRPFEGLVLVPPAAPFLALRQRGADALKLFIEHLDDPHLGSKDAVIDNVVRKLSTPPLPDRPIHRLPYEGLFRRSTGTLTPEHLQQIATITNAAQVALIRRLVPYLNDTVDEFGINTPLRQAHFLAQLAHESDNFNTTEEYASGADYEGRIDLGNVYPGDGVRFKGRGLIQVTGRANYGSCSRGLGLGNTLIQRPTLLNQEDLAARSAGWYWQTRELNPVADRDDVVRVTRIINGGQRGLEDRIAKLRRAKRALKV